ncbi:MAG: hypothetical protein HOM21_05540 [Halobacteriovoraceae bacterium]|nr:hypothetical protein [Halobacteriovoraceae bacterium]
MKYRLPVKIIKAIHDSTLIDQYATPYLLVDAKPNGQNYGGQGVLSDWELAALAANNKNIILAGGLKVQNIEQALAQDVFALDICSGIELGPGIKDHQKMRQLFAAKENYYELVS